MKVDDALVDKLANLAKLQFTDESRDKIKGDMNRMLELVEKLDEVDTEGVAPLAFITDGYQTLREDRPDKPLSQFVALKNAPEKDSDFFKVPKVVSGGNQ